MTTILRIRWDRSVACMGKMKDACKILIGDIKDETTWDIYEEMEGKY
jgi:hypothetical protein